MKPWPHPDDGPPATVVEALAIGAAMLGLPLLALFAWWS